MQSSNIPTKIPLPFAYNAGVGYKNTIPTASQIGVVNGRASLNDGFPPLNFVPISAGGVPPFGSDVNGILNEITAITQWQQAGGFFFYDSSFSTTIGGYPKGAILQSSSNSGLWISTEENNTTNPDTGGAGWMSLAFEGSQAITVTTADVTVTQLQSAYPVLIISGAKTAARSLIMPAIVGEWIIQNNTTGAFTLTAKTAAGTGVTLTQGESTFIYGDGTNILFADSSKVASFNGRVGTVTLNATDVTTALGYTPLNPATIVGTVLYFANTSAPSGYIAANGAAISRTTYSALFTAIGTTWGAGDGSTTFNVPDLRGTFIRGWDNGRGLNPSRTFASYQGDGFGSHAHSVSDPGHAHSVSDPGHAHLLDYYTPLYSNDIDRGSGNQSWFSIDNPVIPATRGSTTNIGINNSYTGIGIYNSGGTETVPKNYALLACIKY